MAQKKSTLQQRMKSSFTKIKEQTNHQKSTSQEEMDNEILLKEIVDLKKRLAERNTEIDHLKSQLLPVTVLSDNNTVLTLSDPNLQIEKTEPIEDEEYQKIEELLNIHLLCGQIVVAKKFQDKVIVHFHHDSKVHMVELITTECDTNFSIGRSFIDVPIPVEDIFKLVPKPKDVKSYIRTVFKIIRAYTNRKKQVDQIMTIVLRPVLEIPFIYSVRKWYAVREPCDQVYPHPIGWWVEQIRQERYSIVRTFYNACRTLIQISVPVANANHITYNINISLIYGLKSVFPQSVVLNNQDLTAEHKSRIEEQLVCFTKLGIADAISGAFMAKSEDAKNQLVIDEKVDGERSSNESFDYAYKSKKHLWREHYHTDSNRTTPSKDINSKRQKKNLKDINNSKRQKKNLKDINNSKRQKKNLKKNNNKIYPTEEVYQKILTSKKKGKLH